MDFGSKLCLAEGNMTPDMLKIHSCWRAKPLRVTGYLLRSNRYEWSKLVPWRKNGWFLLGRPNTSKVVCFFFGGSEIRLLCGILFVGLGKKHIYHVCVFHIYILWRKRNQAKLTMNWRCSWCNEVIENNLKVKICLFWRVNMSCWGTFIDTWLRLSPLPVVVTSIASSLVNSRWLSDTIIPSRILTSLSGRVVQPNSQFISEFYECGRMASFRVSKEQLEWVAHFWSADQR